MYRISGNPKTLTSSINLGSAGKKVKVKEVMPLSPKATEPIPPGTPPATYRNLHLRKQKSLSEKGIERGTDADAEGDSFGLETPIFNRNHF